MANLIRKVTNNLTTDVSLMIPGSDRNHPVTVAGSASGYDLLQVMTDDELEAIQGQLAGLVTSGTFTSTATVSDAGFGAFIPQAAITAPAANTQTNTYVEADVQSIVTLVNELRTKIDAMNGH